jgi:hypothetical protein
MPRSGGGLTVYLPDLSMAVAEKWAREMTTRARKRKYRNHDYGAATRRFEESEEAELLDRLRGIAAEIAVAKLLDLPWHDPKHQSGSSSPDVGHNVGVRWSRRRYLILRPRDPDLFVFFLVTGDPPWMTIEGSIPAISGKRPEFWKGDWQPPAWLVPAAALRAVEQ